MWLKKRDVISNYARTNNSHVMWNGGVIDTCDGRDLVNVVFQSKHLNRIITKLEIYSPFRDLHLEKRENFPTSVIRAIGSFFINEESM